MYKPPQPPAEPAPLARPQPPGGSYAATAGGNGRHSRATAPSSKLGDHRYQSAKHEERMPEPPKYILTLKTDKPLHHEMTALRERYFPPERNKLQAHITLFHALDHLDIVRKDLTNLCRFTSPFKLTTHKPQLRGTFMLIKMDRGHTEACSLRAFLRDKWSKDFEMSDQDLQVSKVEPRAGRNAGWEAHWTIMNKQPDKEVAQQAFEDIQARWSEKSGVAEGVALWEYMRDGTWRHEHDWYFQGGQASLTQSDRR